jgi:uncharacterized protein with GYD domain
MKYVLLGKMSAEWAARQRERTRAAKAKAKALGIKIEAVYYTQGEYDFVDVVDADDATDILAFSVGYAQQGFGRIVTLPAFDSSVMEAVASKL